MNCVTLVIHKGILGKQVQNMNSVLRDEGNMQGMVLGLCILEEGVK